MASHEELKNKLIKDEEDIKKNLQIEIKDETFENLNTVQDFNNALKKFESEHNSFLSFYKNFERFDQEAKRNIFEIVTSSQSDLKMSDEVKIPTKKDVFPWKDRSELEGVLNDYQKWINSKKKDNDVEIQAKYEITAEGELKMSVEELGRFVIFLSRKRPLDLPKFIIYANYAIGEKTRKNKLRNKIISILSMVFRIALSVFSALLFVFTGGLSALGIPPLKALTSVDSATGLMSLTSKGKKLQKISAIGGWASMASFVAPMFINFMSGYVLNDKEEVEKKQQTLKEHLNSIAIKFSKKSESLKNKLNNLAANGKINEKENNALKKKIAEIESKNNNLLDTLNTERNKSQQLQQQNQMYAGFIGQQPMAYPFQQNYNQQNGQPQPQNMYQQYNPQMPINNQQPLNLNNINQQNMNNQLNIPQILNNPQQVQQPILFKDTVIHPRTNEQNNTTTEKTVEQKNKNNPLQNMTKNEKQIINDKDQEKEQQNKEQKQKNNKTKNKKNNLNLYKNKIKQHNNKTADTNKKTINEFQYGNNKKQIIV